MLWGYLNVFTNITSTNSKAGRTCSNHSQSVPPQNWISGQRRNYVLWDENTNFYSRWRSTQKSNHPEKVSSIWYLHVRIPPLMEVRGKVLVNGTATLGLTYRITIKCIACICPHFQTCWSGCFLPVLHSLKHVWSIIILSKGYWGELWHCTSECTSFSPMAKWRECMDLRIGVNLITVDQHTGSMTNGTTEIGESFV
jgi:hypothetical protein